MDPHNFIKKPHIVITKPHNVIIKPHNVITKPHNVIIQHPKVQKPHNAEQHKAVMPFHTRSSFLVHQPRSPGLIPFLDRNDSGDKSFSVLPCTSCYTYWIYRQSRDYMDYMESHSRNLTLTARIIYRDFKKSILYWQLSRRH